MPAQVVEMKRINTGGRKSKDIAPLAKMEALIEFDRHNDIERLADEHGGPQRIYNEMLHADTRALLFQVMRRLGMYMPPSSRLAEISANRGANLRVMGRAA